MYKGHSAVRKVTYGNEIANKDYYKYIKMFMQHLREQYIHP